MIGAYLVEPKPTETVVHESEIASRLEPTVSTARSLIERALGLIKPRTDD